MGSKELVDPQTGEIIPCEIISQDVQGRRNFYIMYMSNMMKLFDIFGGQKYKLLEFIIDNMDSEQKLVMTIKEISQKSHISRQTVIDTLRILEQNNLIVRKTGCIMLNPKLFNNKSTSGEQSLLIKYNQIKKDNNSNNNGFE
jgi:predicted transcriptional regulator